MKSIRMLAKKKSDYFTPAESKDRFEAALRGARIAGPQHVESVTPKRTKPQRKKTKQKQR
jgi:hypothetical protein